MRLLYITNGICGAGGLERVLSIKTSWLIEKYNYDITIITLNEESKEPFFTFNSQIKRVNINVKIHSVFYLFQYINGIQKAVKNIQPDIISVCDDGLKGFFLPLILNKPCPIIYERHASISFNTQSLLGKVKYYLMQISANKFDKFVVLTTSNISEWNSKNVIAIPNSLSNYSNNSSTLVNKKIIVVGSHSYNKGYDLLFKVWEIVQPKFPDWCIHLYGKSDKSESYIKLASKMKLNTSVFFHEPINDIDEKYLESSIFAMTSRSEGFGMVLIEAMSYGVPCIAFDCPSGPRDVIANLEDGFLIPLGDINNFAEKITLLIENDDLRNKMGATAKENVKRFLPEIIIAQWDELFKSIKIPTENV